MSWQIAQKTTVQRAIHRTRMRIDALPSPSRIEEQAILRQLEAALQERPYLRGRYSNQDAERRYG